MIQWLAVLLGAVVGSAPAAPIASAASARYPDVLGEASRRVQSAAAAVAASTRPKGLWAESRAYELARAGHSLLGPGYNVAETREILRRMSAWLASAEARDEARLASAAVTANRLLQLAARKAHPAIADGALSRSAARWAQFVESESEGSADSLHVRLLAAAAKP